MHGGGPPPAFGGGPAIVPMQQTMGQVPAQSNTSDVRVKLMCTNLQYAWPWSTSEDRFCEEPPKELFINGFQRDQFDEWIARLESVRKLRSTYCTSCVCQLSGVFVPCCVPCICKAGSMEATAWDAAIRSWQDDFNNQVLRNCGIFVKTQSCCNVTHDHEGKAERNCERWLSFALVPTEIDRLKNEPHLTGDIQDNSCYFGTNESELCMHPRLGQMQCL